MKTFDWLPLLWQHDFRQLLHDHQNVEKISFVCLRQLLVSISTYLEMKNNEKIHNRAQQSFDKLKNNKTKSFYILKYKQKYIVIVILDNEKNWKYIQQDFEDPFPWSLFCSVLKHIDCNDFEENKNISWNASPMLK